VKLDARNPTPEMYSKYKTGITDQSLDLNQKIKVKDGALVYVP
jgi:hypothetical protein